MYSSVVLIYFFRRVGRALINFCWEGFCSFVLQLVDLIDDVMDVLEWCISESRQLYLLKLTLWVL